MRKLISVLICIAIIAALLAGCSAPPEPMQAPTPEPPAHDADAADPSPSVTDAVPEDSSAVTAEPETPAEEAPEDPAEAEEAAEEAPGQYLFRPKVCSSFMKEVFGETMCETWFALVDAVMAGEDRFACPDAETYRWVMSQFPDRCFPPLVELIDCAGDPDAPVIDGMARFRYTVPQEEAFEQIAAFAALVEDILNQTLEPDYSDFEKALALYEYFSSAYQYDYKAYEKMGELDCLSGYRLLTTKAGICQEISAAYSYMLLQAGLDATNMSGVRAYDTAFHQWTCVRLNGSLYHIDPTYGLGSSGALRYFLMTDDQREAEDSYPRADFVITSDYSKDHPHPVYQADDDRFRPLWGGRYIRFDHETRTMYYEVTDSETQTTTLLSFDYSGW